MTTNLPKRILPETDLWTPRECADYRRCSVRTLDRERELGNGCPYVRIGARIYYRRGDVERFIDAHVCGCDRQNPAVAAEPGAPRRDDPGNRPFRGLPPPPSGRPGRPLKTQAPAITR